MTEVEALAKLLGVPGVLLGLGVWAIRTLVPVWREHLKANATSFSLIATSMQEMSRWQRTIDLRLDRIERIGDQSEEAVRILYERIGQPPPERRRTTPRKDRANEE